MWIFRETLPGPRPACRRQRSHRRRRGADHGRARGRWRSGPGLTWLDAACLSGLRAAEQHGRARLIGKTNLHELAYGISGMNRAYGTPVNPLDPARVPGGSSSGSAVAVASGEADIAYGSDTGGSIRIPAACCGVACLKTTWGRIPLVGVWPLAPSLDTVGPMARNVAGWVAGMALLEPGFTAAVQAPTTVGRVVIGADPVVDDAVDSALAAAGFTVSPADLDGLALATTAAMTVLDAEAWVSDGALAQAAPDLIGRDVLARLRQSATITAAALGTAWQQAAQWKATLAVLWDQVEMLALPTLLGFPPGDNAREMLQIRGIDLPGQPGRAARPGPAGPLAGPAAGQRAADRPGRAVRSACWRREPCWRPRPGPYRPLAALPRRQARAPPCGELGPSAGSQLTAQRHGPPRDRITGHISTASTRVKIKARRAPPAGHNLPYQFLKSG